MKSRTVLSLIALICAGLLSVAVYLQTYRDMLPCPLCVMQRYAYIAIFLSCAIGIVLNAPKSGAAAGLIAALSGAGVAGRHLWIQAHPAVSCGIDPLENFLNLSAAAKLWPTMFKADGLCTAGYDPILGLSIPQWSLAWFVVLSIALLAIIFRRRHVVN